MLRMYEAWHSPHEAQGVALHEEDFISYNPEQCS